MEIRRETALSTLIGYPKTILGLSILALAISPDAMAQSQIAGTLTGLQGLNATQIGMGHVIEEACPSGANARQFQDRCNALVGAALDQTRAGTGPLDAATALQQAAPEQIISQGTGATKASFNTIAGRLIALRAGARGFQVAGLSFNGQPVTSLAGLSPYSMNGGAAGDDGSEIWERLGVFVNGNYNTGNVDSSFQQLGFNFNSGSITAGMDYRLTKDLILGTAFSYARTESGFDRNGGSLNSDAYTGAVYGTYYATDSLYFDGIATFGGIDYDSIRKIQYTVPQETINTRATANPTGQQYSVSLGGGYNFSMQEWTLNPYARLNYLKLDVDKFNETGGLGWGMGFNDQTVESVTTALGTQLSYSLSTPWGVLLPSIRGEWYHQYKDSRRNIGVRFLGDTTSGLTFNTVTESPDRNYFIVGAGVSGTFAKGISGFLNYDSLVGYRNVTSHLFTAGVRMAF